MNSEVFCVYVLHVLSVFMHVCIYIYVLLALFCEKLQKQGPTQEQWTTSAPSLLFLNTVFH